MKQNKIPQYGYYIIGTFILVLMLVIGGLTYQSHQFKNRASNDKTELFYLNGFQVSEKTYGENQRRIDYGKAKSRLDIALYKKVETKPEWYTIIPDHIKILARDKATDFVGFQAEVDARRSFEDDNYVFPHSSYADLFQTKYKEYLDEYLKQYRYVLK